MQELEAELDLVYVTARQRLPQGIVEYRWNSAGGEILGHRNERLIADLRAALHHRAAGPEYRVPSLLGRSSRPTDPKRESAIRLRLLKRYPAPGNTAPDAISSTEVIPDTLRIGLTGS